MTTHHNKNCKYNQYCYSGDLEHFNNENHPEGLYIINNEFKHFDGSKFTIIGSIFPDKIKQFLSDPVLDEEMKRPYQIRKLLLYYLTNWFYKANWENKPTTAIKTNDKSLVYLTFSLADEDLKNELLCEDNTKKLLPIFHDVLGYGVYVTRRLTTALQRRCQIYANTVVVSISKVGKVKKIPHANHELRYLSFFFYISYPSHEDTVGLI